jgi:hypothetical protein
MRIITSFDTFKQATGLDGKADKRGPKIVKIDAAFQDYEASFDKAEPAEKIRLTASLFLACKNWLQAKAGKKEVKTSIFGTTVNNNLKERRKHIGALADECLAALALLDESLVPLTLFDQKKITSLVKGPPVPFTKALSAYYEHERKAYENRKKTSAPAASLIGTAFTEAEKEKLSLSKFEKLAAKSPDALVKYMKKKDRLKVMCALDAKSRFIRPDTQKNIDCGVNVLTDPAAFLASLKNKGTRDLFNAGLFPYAMDGYGNLFSSEEEKGPELAAQGYAIFNHSSFNAGKDVICAGFCIFQDGQLRWMDNNSGHYKPGVEHLLNALQVLASDGADLSETFVGVLNTKNWKQDIYTAHALLGGARAPDVGVF